MKLIKIVLILVVLLVLLVVGVAVGAFLYVDTIAKRGIERGGTYALGVNTTLDSASVGIFAGTFKMSDLKVANAADFPGPHFLKLGDGAVAVSLGTLREPVVELPHLKLDEVDVYIEKRGDKTNYGTILEHFKRVTGGDGAGGDKPAPGPTGDEKKFIVDEMSIRRVTVHVDMLGGPGAIGELTKVTVPIDEVKLHNVGRTGTGVGGTGVTMSELTGIIVQAVLAAAAEKGGGVIPADLLADLQGQLASIGDIQGLGMEVLGEAQAKIEEVGKQAGEAAKKVEEAAKDIGKTIEGLLPKKKDEKK